MLASVTTSAVQHKVVSEIAAALRKPLAHRQKGWIQSQLKEDLCLDSLDIVEVILHLEKKYAIEFEGEVMPRIATVADLAQHTLELIRHKQGGLHARH